MVRIAQWVREALDALGFDPDSFKRAVLTTAELAEMTGFDESTFSEWRHLQSKGFDVGPAFVKEKKSVVYPLGAVVEWLLKRRQPPLGLPEGATQLVVERPDDVPAEIVDALVPLLRELERALTDDGGNTDAG